MPKRTVVCPNGCSPDYLQRDFGIAPQTTYLCEECGWEAIWRKGKRLDVIHPGSGRESFAPPPPLEGFHIIRRSELRH